MKYVDREMSCVKLIPYSNGKEIFMKQRDLKEMIFFAVEEVLVIIDVLVLRLRGIIVMQAC